MTKRILVLGINGMLGHTCFEHFTSLKRFKLFGTARGGASENIRMFDAAAIVTTGWAAPLRPDGTIEGAPSEHALRRRVRLVVVVADNGVASALRFADEPDEVVTDPGSATGTLAEAITRFWFDPPITLAANS
jgi:hypothetical protein